MRESQSHVDALIIWCQLKVVGRAWLCRNHPRSPDQARLTSPRTLNKAIGVSADTGRLVQKRPCQLVSSPRHHFLGDGLKPVSSTNQRGLTKTTRKTYHVSCHKIGRCTDRRMIYPNQAHPIIVPSRCVWTEIVSLPAQRDRGGII